MVTTLGIVTAVFFSMQCKFVLSTIRCSVNQIHHTPFAKDQQGTYSCGLQSLHRGLHVYWPYANCPFGSMHAETVIVYRA